jgi:hypothetical protein
MNRNTSEEISIPAHEERLCRDVLECCVKFPEVLPFIPVLYLFHNLNNILIIQDVILSHLLRLMFY